MKSYEDHVKEMRELIEHHNRSNPNPLDHGDLIDRLRREHSTEEALNLLGSRELQDMGIPEMLAKDIVRSWRGGIKVIVDTTPEAEAARLSIRELIEKYDPDDPSNAFGTRLATLAGKDNNQNPNAFLIFKDDSVFRDATFKELSRLRAGFPSRSIANHDGTPFETFAVGNRPPRYKEQSPWNPQEALYEGFSNAGVKWMDLDLETRQLVSIASTSNQPDFQKYTEFVLFEVLANAADSFKTAARLFPAAATQFHDLKRKGSLPSMKIPVGESTAVSGPSPSTSSGGTSSGGTSSGGTSSGGTSSGG
jgi:hypothetical protein